MATMDYRDLKLASMQIRLMTIEPVPDGIATQNCPIQCRMEVRRQPLPTHARVPDSGSLSPNYVYFDHYIKKPPSECFGASLRRDVANIEKQAENSSLASRIADKTINKLWNKIGLPTSTPQDILIPVDDIPKLLTKEDFLGLTEDIRDGWPNMRIAHRESGPMQYGKLPLKDLNPLFRASRPIPKENSPSIDPDNYVALSYAWGPEEPTESIYINGQLVEVRENLAAALRQLRTIEYFRGGGKIWIDALCINQEDNEEKEDQLNMMGLIYNLAGNIMVWLGVEDNSSSSIIDWLETWSVFNRIEFIEVFDGSDPLTATTWRNMAQLRLRTVGRNIIKEKFLESMLAADEAIALHKFFDRPYWHRLWIIQELAMGRPGMPIVCGSRITQWRYIRDAVLLHTPIFDRLREATQAHLARMGTANIELEYSLQHVAQIAQLEISGHRKRLQHINSERLPIYAPAAMRQGPLHGSPLRQALLLASRAHCSKAHDRVYGMLSIPGLPRLRINVDYSKKISAVFFEFTAACVENESLDFFSLLDGIGMSQGTEAGETEDDDPLPSWVPDYAAVSGRKIGIIDGDWRAGGQTGGEFPSFFGVMGSCSPPKVNGGSLICSASIVDEVDGVGAISKADLDTGALGMLEPSMTEIKQPTSEVTTWPRAESVLHQVLVGGCDLSGSKNVVENSFRSLYTAFPGKFIVESALTAAKG